MVITYCQGLRKEYWGEPDDKNIDLQAAEDSSTGY